MPFPAALLPIYVGLIGPPKVSLLTKQAPCSDPAQSRMFSVTNLQFRLYSPSLYHADAAK